MGENSRLANMSLGGIYVVTGSLGAGKTLGCVYQIQEALIAGCRIATNLDLKPEYLVSGKKRVNITRLPDYPKKSDLDAIGLGCEGYNEKSFGLMVLDEVGTFLNSRDWNDKTGERDKLIKWLRHARKYHWNLLLIIQDIGSLDKQVREALAEHVVICKRMDRITIPGLNFLASVFGGRIAFPKIHIGIVKYGKSQFSPVVARWKYFGGSLYAGYNTEQKILGDIESSSTPLCLATAPYLKRPVGRSQALYDLCSGLARLFPWMVDWIIPLSCLKPSEALHRHLEFTAYESGVKLDPQKSSIESWIEWLQTDKGPHGPSCQGVG